MAYQESPSYLTHEAGQDLSGSQFCFVSIASDGQIDPTGAGLKTVGVLQDKPDAAGKDALVQDSGITKAKAGGALATIGTALTTDASGRVVAATTGDIVHATLLEAAGAADDIISVQLHINGYISP